MQQILYNSTSTSTNVMGLTVGRILFVEETFYQIRRLHRWHQSGVLTRRSIHIRHQSVGPQASERGLRNETVKASPLTVLGTAVQRSLTNQLPRRPGPADSPGFLRVVERAHLVVAAPRSPPRSVLDSLLEPTSAYFCNKSGV